MSSTNPSPQESSSDNDLNDLLALLGSESESPSSTIPSIEDSLVQQLDSFEEVNEQQKTTLPPCQVCGGPSSGFHYGAYTCEACKVFFRRSSDRCQTYVCITRRNQCFPTEDHFFVCKQCRYKKCLEIGMSRTNIKIGRYSRERHKDNKNKLAVLEQKRTTVPYLVKFSDAQDIIIACNCSFEQLIKIKWQDEIAQFHDEFLEVQRALDIGFFSKDEFMDIYKVTGGVEVDHRRLFSNFCGKIVQSAFGHFVTSVRKLPGLDELSSVDFIETVIENREDIQLPIAITQCNRWINNSLFMHLDDDHVLEVSKDALAQLTDTGMADLHQKCSKRLDEANLTFEESTFLVSLNLLYPKRGRRHLIGIHQRFILAFTRYLECQYGKNYHKRLHELMNLMSFLKIQSMTGRKWLDNNEEYLNTVHTSKIMKLFVKNLPVDQACNILKELKL